MEYLKSNSLIKYVIIGLAIIIVLNVRIWDMTWSIGKTILYLIIIIFIINYINPPFAQKIRDFISNLLSIGTSSSFIDKAKDVINKTTNIITPVNSENDNLIFNRNIGGDNITLNKNISKGAEA